MLTLNARIIKQFIAVVFYAAIVLFLGFYIQNLDLSELNKIDVNWLFMLLALPFSVLSRVFLPYIWVQLIKIYHDISTKNDYVALNYIYAKTWLGKYIPGNVAYIAGKIYFASERGINKTILSITSVLEIILQLLSALLLGVFFLLISGGGVNIPSSYRLLFLVATCIGIVTLIPAVFNGVLALGYKVVKKSELPNNYRVKAGKIFKIGFMYALVHALSAFPIYFFIRAIGYETSLIETIYVSGAFIFAGAVGALAIFVPSGLGVREAVLLILLTGILTPETALILVISLRLWSVMLDVFYWLISRLALTLWN